ncbi:MAG: GtrA family protein [Glaciihabitans sp.]|jgi:putative flippase GtrA|nr:GtrA family protein [Glaciihabitans sp.]
MRTLIAQLARFGVVGAVGFVVDVGIFNVLRVTVFSPTQIHEGPVWAKVVSTSIAIVINWLGNRYWTFRKEARKHPLSEAIEFFVVSLVGMGIGLGCLWISHYVLGYTSQLADNISANVVGLALGTLFRFALYRLWVFNPKRTGAGKRPHKSATEISVREDALGAAETPV